MGLLKWLGNKLDDGSHGTSWMMFGIIIICSLIIVFVFQSVVADVKAVLAK